MHILLHALGLSSGQSSNCLGHRLRKFSFFAQLERPGLSKQRISYSPVSSLVEPPLSGLTLGNQIQLRQKEVK